LVLHEPPLASLLPKGEGAECIDFLFECLTIYKNEGVEAAMEKFNEVMVGMDDGLPMVSPPAKNQVVQWEYEAPWMGIYCPDLERIKVNLGGVNGEKGMRVVVAYGKKSGEAMYVRSGRVLAERLGCERVEFPGHHQGFQSEWEEFAPILREVLMNGGAERSE
jgi:hypothetical protein